MACVLALPYPEPPQAKPGDLFSARLSHRLANASRENCDSRGRLRRIFEKLMVSRRGQPSALELSSGYEWRQLLMMDVITQTDCKDGKMHSTCSGSCGHDCTYDNMHSTCSEGCGKQGSHDNIHSTLAEIVVLKV